MIYPFMTLNDETEITHTEMFPDGKIKVYVEKPHETDGFHNAVYWLPERKWEEIKGFTEEEIQSYKEFVDSLSHLIIEFSLHGGFGNASNI